MSNSRVSRRSKFRWLAIVILFAGALVLAILQPAFQSLRQRRAQQLAGIAAGIAPTDSRQAIVYYDIAKILYPRGGYQFKIADLYLSRGNPDAAIQAIQSLTVGESGLRIAQIQFDSGQYAAAVKTLNRFGNDKPTDAYVLQSKAELELGQNDAAIADAKAAGEHGAGPRRLGLAFATAGKKTELAVLIQSVTDPTDLAWLNRIASNDTSLGQELYSEDMLKSAERILSSHPTNSEDFRLLTLIKLASAQPTHKDLQATQDYLNRGLAADPGNVALRRMLRDTDNQLGDKAAAAAQSKLIDQLETGRI